MDRNRFYFKHFSVAHTRSSLKVGVDGVLVGLWSNPEGCRHVLDAGTGCGVIALIVAQLTENPDAVRPALIDAIDIDAPSIEEADGNFRDSPWSRRLSASTGDLREWSPGEGYDLIVSNPPFFRSGISDVSSARLAARHQESLPLAELLGNCSRLLMPGGRTVIILPYEFKEEAISGAGRLGLAAKRLCRVRGHGKAPWKRILLDFVKTMDAQPLPEEKSLTLETVPGVPTDEYRTLGKEFYLKF